jgi:hypothetical protein
MPHFLDMAASQVGRWLAPCRLALILLLAVAVDGMFTTAQAYNNPTRCPLTPNASAVSLPPRVASVFDPFTASELGQIGAHVKSRLSLLDAIPEDTVRGNYLYAVDFLSDAKSTVLRTIDGGESYPGRFAKAIVYHLTSEDNARVVEYKVGPIRSFPISSSVPVVAMRQPGNYADGTSLPATMRPTTGEEYGLLDEVISAAMEQLANFTIASYGQTYADGNMYWTDSAPRGYTKNTRQTWVWFMWAREGMFALPLGLAMLVDHKSLDSANWRVLQLAYNGQGPFNSVSALMRAFSRGTLAVVRNTMPPASSTNNLFSSMRRRGAFRPLETQRPPVTMNAGGPRYVVSGRQISWMNWDMHMSDSSLWPASVLMTSASATSALSSSWPCRTPTPATRVPRQSRRSRSTATPAGVWAGQAGSSCRVWIARRMPR